MAAIRPVDKCVLLTEVHWNGHSPEFCVISSGNIWNYNRIQGARQTTPLDRSPKGRLRARVSTFRAARRLPNCAEFDSTRQVGDQPQTAHLLDHGKARIGTAPTSAEAFWSSWAKEYGIDSIEP